MFDGAGGSTCIKGFEERLSDELKTYISKSVSVRAGKQIQLIAKAQRKYSAWIGAAKMSTMHECAWAFLFASGNNLRYIWLVASGTIRNV